MEEYVENYKYNNCFWKKSGVLYNHSESRFKEYMSVGEMLKLLGKGILDFNNVLEKVPSLYIPSKEIHSTRANGISVLIESIKILKDKFSNIYKNIHFILKGIFDKIDSYESKKVATKMCDDCHKRYQSELNKLSSTKKSYNDIITKTIEFYINQKLSNKIDNNKIKGELENKKRQINNKQMEYKKQIENVENCRVEYMEFQGNIFASVEELEQECTDQLKIYFKKLLNLVQNFNFNLSEEKIDIINNMSGYMDNKMFAEKNKSLITGPKRNPYVEYAQDLNYYCEHFEILKSKLKGKNKTEIREIKKNINNEINNFLNDIVQKESDEVHIKIEQIAHDIKNNKLTQNDFEYLENQFKSKYEQFKKWKQKIVGDQDYKKVGKEWEDRFCYMHTFLGYFNKTRSESKELDKTNFEYLSKAIQLILKLNENEDIDYSLCDLIVILSSTFFTSDPNGKNGKIYINDIIKQCSIMQKQGFWVGLTRYVLNEQIQQQNKAEETLREDDMTEEKLNNSVIAKLMSMSYNIVQFVMDSNLFNRIIYDIFKYCKINEQNREIVIGMLESQIENENLTFLKLDKELLLSSNKNDLEEEEKEKENNNKINEEK